VSRPLRVLRLCSVFLSPSDALTGRGAGFDPVGGMQSHTGQLTAALDRLGVVQRVVTSRPPGTPARQTLGRHAVVRRHGLPLRMARQGYWAGAAPTLMGLAPGADLVHVHLGEDIAVLPLAFAAAARGRLPVVMTVHTSVRHTLVAHDWRSEFVRRVGGPIEHLAERRADAVIPLTDRLAALLTRAGVDPDRVTVIPSGIDPQLFAHPGDDPLPPSTRPRVLYVGRLHAQKGVQTLLRAVPLLRSDVDVVVIGDGPHRAELERLAGELGVGDRVRFLGFLHHDRVPDALRAADLLVMPSRYEELGSTLLEAMAAGLPVVASNTGGIPSVVEDGVTGRLVEPDDVASFARAIDEVVGDADARALMSAYALERAGAFEWPALAERVLEVYRAAAAHREVDLR
jgi:glycogen(starch) synthase